VPAFARPAAEVPGRGQGDAVGRLPVRRPAPARRRRPRPLILDEAVAALDVSVQAQVLAQLCEQREDLVIAYLFISRGLAVVRQVGDQCVVMHHGRIVEHGDTATLLAAPQRPYPARLLAAVPREGRVPERGLPAGSR
jgi:oligopeptide transport system ATP-binding protein